MSRSLDIAAARLEEVLAIADALERSAVARYAALAHCMRQVGNSELAAIFEGLSAEEKLHVGGVERLSHELLRGSPRADLREWTLPETFGAEEIGPVALLTPYKALSIAVRAEERAFAFWSYVASEADGDDVRSEAEGMARQELVHAAKLRHVRRQAYHAERAHRARPEVESRTAHGAAVVRDDLNRSIAVAAGLLLSAARKLERIPDHDSALLLYEIADDLRAFCGSVVTKRPASEAAWRIERADIAGAAGVLFEGAGVLERCAEHCLSLLDQSSDTAAIDLARQAGEKLAAHVARLNARLGVVEPALAELSAEPASRHPAPGGTS
jgi:rubrerythrin